jgi:hypothetical protein
MCELIWTFNDKGKHNGIDFSLSGEVVTSLSRWFAWFEDTGTVGFRRNIKDDFIWSIAGNQAAILPYMECTPRQDKTYPMAAMFIESKFKKRYS